MYQKLKIKRTQNFKNEILKVIKKKKMVFPSYKEIQDPEPVKRHNEKETIDDSLITVIKVSRSLLDCN